MTDLPNPQAERARELRRAGRTLAEIKAELGLRSNSQLYAWVRDIPAPAWTRRPRAKDAERARALELRALGGTHRGIAAELGVSKASVSEWLRPPGRPRSAESLAARRRRVGIGRQQEKLAAARAVGALTDRELLLVGAVAYWAEGTKAKPWCPGEALTFTNSDPDMIRLFLRWLDLLGVDPQRLRFTVQIHESADVAEATRFWADVVGAPPRRSARRCSSATHRGPTARTPASAITAACGSTCVNPLSCIAGWRAPGVGWSRGAVPSAAGRPAARRYDRRMAPAFGRRVSD